MKPAGGVANDVSSLESAWSKEDEMNALIRPSIALPPKHVFASAPPVAMGPGQGLPVQLKVQTAAEKAESLARGLQAQQGSARAVALRAAQEAVQNKPGMVMQDVAKLSPTEARDVLATVQKLIDLSGSQSWSMSGANNGVATRSLQTYADWLHDRAATSTNLKA